MQVGNYLLVSGEIYGIDGPDLQKEQQYWPFIKGIIIFALT
jgi:hypothetical protein